MKILLSSIYNKAGLRPVGYIQDVISRGIIKGQYLEISQENVIELYKKYNPNALLPPISGSINNIKQLNRTIKSQQIKPYQTTSFVQNNNAASISGSNQRTIGLGDIVSSIAQPIAIGIDAMTSLLPKKLQTNIKSCGGCARRKENLNKIQISL